MDEGSEQPKVSVVVPAFNADNTLAELIPRLLQALSEHYSDFELIIVDDGSDDETWTTIHGQARSSDHVVGVRLARNFGQTPALCAGITGASGDVIATIDADFDTYPEDLPRLIEAVTSGADLANGVRSGRNFRRGLPSRLFNNRMRNAGMGYDDIGCGMVAMTREVALEALQHGEFRRSFRFKILLGALADSIVEVPVRAGPHSSSSHRLADLFSSGLEAGLSQRRTIFLGAAGVGAAVSAVGAVVTVASLILAVSGGTSGWWLGAAWGSLVALVGALLCLTAIATNLVLRSTLHQATPFFRIASTVNWPDDD